jgi:hypothetical protein
MASADITVSGSWSVTEPGLGDGWRPRPLPPRLSPLARAKRIGLIALGACLFPVIVSFAAMLTQPSNSTFTIRAFEWLRDNGAAGVAVQAEDIYYSLTAPATGGPGLRSLPAMRRARAEARRLRLAAAVPANIPSVITPPLASEGVWAPSESWSSGGSPVQITEFRSDPNYPRMVAGVAWINTARTRIVLYPGLSEPSLTLPRGPMEVPPQQRSLLLATFNSAFKLEDSGGGFALDGRAYAPMRSGMATFVGYANGTVDVQAWAGGPQVPPNVVFARQNLPLIVQDGRPNPNLSDGPQWGVTVGNAIRVWRSGLGVDARGNLIYAAANDQTVGSLAAILIRAGAVRAMQLDINSYWVSFITYRHPDAVGASNLLAAMNRSSQRYLTPDDRDFFAVYLR